MGSVSGLLITVRTSRQGAAMEKGKHSAEYQEEIAALTMNPEDYALLDLGADKKAVIKSAVGEVSVTCRTGDGPKGLFFLPLGPVANQLIGAETAGTGVPDFKGVSVVLTANVQN